jgi:diguanylate cyclase (GGDEF)-like protein
VTDRWGDWVSGLAPIIDPESRNVVAVYGFDVSAKNWQATIARFRWLAFTISGLVTTTIVLFGLFGLGQLRLAAKTRYTARHDVLTGLLNRRVFVERVQQIVSERGDQGLAVLYLDLDHFKDVNDTLGHSVGDEFLRAVAERLRRNVRQTDCVARCGGDEFAVVIEGGGISAEAEKLAARLVSSIGEPFKIDGNNIRSNASIGIAVCKSRDDDAEMILSHADIALYQAKSEGRGSYQYSPKRWTRKCAHA